MSRIGGSISGLESFFLAHLARLDNATIDSAIRLTTGKKVNRPSDDPAAFIQISSLEQEWNAVQSARKQVDVAASIGAGAQLVVDEVRSQLDVIRTALELDEDGSLTDEERTAQQATIDAAVEAINEASRSKINGRRYFDGSSNYGFAGRDSSQISQIKVYAARETDFSGTVTSAATQATANYQGKGGSRIDKSATFTLTGERGMRSFSVTANESLSDAADRINAESHRTGITAEVNGNDIDFTSVDYGDNATIAFEVSTGTFNTTGSYQGSDAVVTINGKSIDASQVDGNRVSFYDNGTHVVFDFAAGFSGAFNPVSISDSNVAKFTLSTNLADKTNLAISGLSAGLLGGVSGRVTDLLSGGSLAGLGDNTSQALRVIDEALAGLTLTEASVDAFADVAVDSAASLLAGLDENLSETLNSINGVNEEEETLLLTKNQALSGNAVAAISILQQQQYNMLSLVKLLAGV